MSLFGPAVITSDYQSRDHEFDSRLMRSFFNFFFVNFFNIFLLKSIIIIEEKAETELLSTAIFPASEYASVLQSTRTFC